VNVRTGELQLNAAQWQHLTDDEKRLIVLHELGHFRNATHDEHIADAFAFAQYANEGRSLKAAVKTLTTRFSAHNPEQYQRAKLQLYRALAYDAHHNNNPQAKEKMKTTYQMLYPQRGTTRPNFTGCDTCADYAGYEGSSDYANFKFDASSMGGIGDLIGGLGKAAGDIGGSGIFDNAELRAQKAALQRETLVAVEREKSKAAADAQVRIAQANNQGAAQNKELEPPKDGKPLPVWAWVAIGVGGLVLLGGTIWAIMKKK
jgi:hypothetical protein